MHTLLETACIEWRDGAPFSTSFNDIYFDTQQGPAESNYLFVNANRLPQRFSRCTDSFVIAETGFGTGLNFLNTLRCWTKNAPPNARLTYYSIEKHPLTSTDLQRCIRSWPELAAEARKLMEIYPVCVPGWHVLKFHELNIVLVLIFGDIRTQIPELRESVDAWFLDGFDPKKNPDMWTGDLFDQMAGLSHPETTLATFTVAGPVRRGLLAAGFVLEKKKGFGKKREMLTGHYTSHREIRVREPWFSINKQTIHNKQIAIIGAGIAGVTSAFAFASRGWQVTLIDQAMQPLLAGSGNPSAVLMPKTPTDQAIEGRFYQQAQLFAFDTLSSLSHQHKTLQWHPSGVLQLLIEPDYVRISELGISTDYLELHDAHSLHEELDLPVGKKAVFYKKAGWLNPQSLVELLDADQCAIKFCGGTHVSAYAQSEQGWRLIDQNGNEIIHSPNILLANAFGIQHDPNFKDLSLEVIRGQVSYLPKAKLSSDPPAFPVIGDAGYVTPTLDDYLCLGATYDRKYLDNTVRAEDHRANLEGNPLLGETNSLGFETLKGRSALRALTKDHLPVVGPAYDADYYYQHYADVGSGKRPNRFPQARYLPGLYLNVGHGSRGFVSSWIAAEYLCRLLENDTQILPATLQRAIHPARFLIRRLKRK